MKELAPFSMHLKYSAAGIFQPYQFCGVWAGANSWQLSADVVMSAKSNNWAVVYLFSLMEYP